MKKGDRVAVLDDVMTGTVVMVKSSGITVLTEDDFEMEFQASELVVIGNTFSEKNMNFSQIHDVIKEKETTQRKKTLKVRPKERTLPPMEVDLHIHQLVKYTKGMSNYDMLSMQIDTAKRQLDFAMSKRIQKVVFIHGVGAGVLRAELEYLFKRYDNLKYYDANFQKYGRGAVEIYIFQNVSPS